MVIQEEAMTLGKKLPAAFKSNHYNILLSLLQPSARAEKYINNKTQQIHTYFTEDGKLCSVLTPKHHCQHEVQLQSWRGEIERKIYAINSIISCDLKKQYSAEEG